MDQSFHIKIFNVPQLIKFVYVKSLIIEIESTNIGVTKAIFHDSDFTFYSHRHNLTASIKVLLIDTRTLPVWFGSGSCQ